mgnify:CR=1 FL=1
MKTGRPKKYTDEFLMNESIEMEKFFADESKVFLKEFAIERKYPSYYISIWATENEEFSKTLNRCKDIQEIRILKMGLTLKWNPYMTGLTLKNVAGWRDKTEVEHSGFIETAEEKAKIKSEVKDFMESMGVK